MPIYEYACMECEDHFDELVRSDDQVITCPSCNATDVLKQISAFAVHGAAAKPSFGGSGGGCCGGSLRLRVRNTALAAEPVRLARLDWPVDGCRRPDPTRSPPMPPRPPACTSCRLAETRSQVVFGSGDPDAELMIVGEAPGYHEDQGGLPFAGQAGELLAQLLAGIGLAPESVYLANVLKCRPPQNRDPLEAEIAACEPHLFRQIELVRPRVVATLGNFATKLLSGRSFGITRVHGQEQEVTLASTTVLLYPLYHPAAALYTPSMLKALEDDFARLPALLGHADVRPVAPRTARPGVRDETPTAVEDPDRAEDERTLVGAVQLGLF